MTDTTTTIPPPQQQPQNTWSSTSFDDDGHYSDIQLSGSGGPAGIPTGQQSLIEQPDHYNDQVTTNEGTVEQRQTSPDHYEGLDPSVLPALRQLPAPHEYAGIGQPNTIDMS